MLREKSKSGSPASSARSIPVRTGRKRYKSVHTNTDPDYKCQKCEERELLSFQTDSEDFRENYIKSINYINSCHGIMNELLTHRNPSLSNKPSKTCVLMPDLPNFLDVYAVLQETPSNSQQSSRESSTKSSETVINLEEKQRYGSSEEINKNYLEEKQEENQRTEGKRKRSILNGINPKTNFMELVPDIKSTEEFKQLERQLLEENSENEKKRSISQERKQHLLKSKRNRMKDEPKFCSETSCEKNHEKHTQYGNEKSRSTSAMDAGEYEKDSRKFQSEIYSHNNKEKNELHQKMERRSGEENNAYDVLEKYAKKLLESTDSSRQSSPRKSLLQKQSSSGPNTRKVKFSDHLINYNDEDVLKIHNPDSCTNENTEYKAPNNSQKQLQQNKTQPKTANEELPKAPNFDMTQNSTNKNSFMLHNYSFPDTISNTAFDINMPQKRTSNTSKRSYNFVSPATSNTNPPYYFMLNQNQTSKQQKVEQRKVQNYTMERKETEESDGDQDESDVTEKDFIAECLSDSDTDYIPSDSDSDGNLADENSEENNKTSHPLKLNQRSLSSVDENAVISMGLFTKNGELPRDIIKILEEEKLYRSRDSRNKQFRVPRTLDEHTCEKKDVAKFNTNDGSKRSSSSGSSNSSDIKSDGEFESIEHSGSSVYKENVRGKALAALIKESNFRSPLAAQNLNSAKQGKYR